MKKDINITSSSLTNIADFFDLGSISHSEAINRGLSNRSYIINTSSGDYVFKFLVVQNTNSITSDIAIQKQLKFAKIETPEYLQNNVGQYIFEKDGIKAVVSRKIEGVVPTISNPALARELGKSLALFHKHVTEIPYENKGALLHPSISGIFPNIDPKGFPSGIIHGDFHMENVLISPKNQKILAIMDFEEAHRNVYLIDLGILLMGAGANSNDKLSLVLLREIIKGYETSRKLEVNEKKLMIAAMEYSAKAWIKWFLANGYNKYATKHQYRLSTLEKISTKELFH